MAQLALKLGILSENPALALKKAKKGRYPNENMTEENLYSRLVEHYYPLLVKRQIRKFSSITDENNDFIYNQVKNFIYKKRTIGKNKNDYAAKWHRNPVLPNKW